MHYLRVYMVEFYTIQAVVESGATEAPESSVVGDMANKAADKLREELDKLPCEYILIAGGFYMIFFVFNNPELCVLMCLLPMI